MVEVARIEVRVHVHATEDEEKVMEALMNVLGIRSLPELKVLKAKGHHGNPIETIYLELKGKKAKEVVTNIFKRMPKTEFSILLLDLDNLVEGSKLHLRFDKQEAYSGKLVFSRGSDVIRVVIVFKGIKPSEKLLKEIRGAE